MTRRSRSSWRPSVRRRAELIAVGAGPRKAGTITAAPNHQSPTTRCPSPDAKPRHMADTRWTKPGRTSAGSARRLLAPAGEAGVTKSSAPAPPGRPNPIVSAAVARTHASTKLALPSARHFAARPRQEYDSRRLSAREGNLQWPGTGGTRCRGSLERPDFCQARARLRLMGTSTCGRKVALRRTRLRSRPHEQQSAPAIADRWVVAARPGADDCHGAGHREEQLPKRQCSHDLSCSPYRGLLAAVFAVGCWLGHPPRWLLVRRGRRRSRCLLSRARAATA